MRAYYTSYSDQIYGKWTLVPVFPVTSILHEESGNKNFSVRVWQILMWGEAEHGRHSFKTITNTNYDIQKDMKGTWKIFIFITVRGIKKHVTIRIRILKMN